MSRGPARAAIAFWLAALALAALKLWLNSDLTLQIVYNPADDTLYVLRAWHLLRGEGYGLYDSTLLVKYPGQSLWIAAMHQIGLPHLLSVDLLYLGAGLYLAGALLACGARPWLVLVSFVLYAFNPVTFGSEWIRPIREPLSTGLLALLVGAMAQVLAARQAGRWPWGHAALLALVFAFSLFVREEDRLLWGLLALFGGALAWQGGGALLRDRRALAFAAAVLVVPGVAGKLYELALRDFASRHYGLPILHEFGEGEYPRLLAAMRGVHAAKDNRMVLLPQETIDKLAREVPSFAPVAKLLPKPGPRTLSCQLHGVCSEWSNGWMPFWVKEEAFRAGLTPSLAQAQDYYKRVRTDIEGACASGRLACSPRGSGIVAPPELRWTRAYVAEAWRLAKWALGPEVGPLAGNPAVYDVALEIGRMYREVAGAKFDERLHAGYGVPAAAATAAAGGTGTQGWLRQLIAPVHRLIGALILLASFAALAWRFWVAARAAPDALALVGMVFGAFVLARLAILAWLAVSMGQFAPRIVFATYAVTLMIALPFAAAGLRDFRKRGTA